MPNNSGRDKSLRLIRDINDEPKYIRYDYKDGDTEDPSLNDVFPQELAQIVKSFKMPDGNTTIIIQGKNDFAFWTGRLLSHTTERKWGF